MMASDAMTADVAASAAAAKPQAATTPLNVTMKTLDGKDVDIGVSTGTQHIEEGRDYFNDTRRPGYEPLVYPHPLQLPQPEQGVSD